MGAGPVTKEAYARESRRAKQNRIAVEASLPRSTAPWDQPRNGTTTTYYFDGAETATEADVLAHMARERPDMKDPKVELIHYRKPAYDSRGPSVCVLISWANSSYRP